MADESHGVKASGFTGKGLLIVAAVAFVIVYLAFGTMLDSVLIGKEKAAMFKAAGVPLPSPAPAGWS
jgi:hypothetical protein